MTDALLIETADKVLSSVATLEAIEAAEVTRWSGPIWDAVAEIGLPWISVPEVNGGVGGSLGDAIDVLVQVGRHAAPIPMAETGLLGGWLLAHAGLEVGDGPVSVVPGHGDDDLRLEGGRLFGTAHRIAWASSVDRLAALVGGQIVVVSPAHGAISAVSNVAGEPRDTVRFAGATPEAVTPAPDGVTPEALRRRGALSRAALMAGALGAMSDLSVAYTAERRQFGKPVGSFQAVQALLVRAAEEAVLVDLAVQVAARETERGEGAFETVSAKILANEAARAATRAAHQAHGAMGATREYPLHHLSRRLWAWRAEYGDAQWPALLGDALIEHGADDLYDVIADGSASTLSL